MFHLKLKVKYNTGYFASKIPCDFARLKRNAHLPVSLRANDVCPTGKSKLWGVQLPIAKIFRATLKNKNKGLLCRPSGRPCFLFLCCHILIKRWGVWNFLEPSKIRFKRGFFFFTINQLQSIKKAPQVTLRFLILRNVSVHSFSRMKKINFKK